VLIMIVEQLGDDRPCALLQGDRGAELPSGSGGGRAGRWRFEWPRSTTSSTPTVYRRCNADRTAADRRWQSGDNLAGEALD